MRSKEEVMNLILSYAKNDDRVRAVGMCGSRVNPKTPRDHFQDYDIVFIVSEMESFLSDPTWVDYFGERFLTQMPEQTTLFPPSLGGKFSYLMLFQDYTRIDLTLCPLSLKEDWNRGGEGISTILLDKDDLFRAPQLLSDKQYHLQMPTEANFLDCCNEFWWVCTYVVKVTLPQ
ncbi:aminoglycoside 6-adenylyltransferase [Priestia flexa]|nr:aminoglycoside 6-adenylyltransferase [Priestia flexa]